VFLTPGFRAEASSGFRATTQGCDPKALPYRIVPLKTTAQPINKAIEHKEVKKIGAGKKRNRKKAQRQTAKA